jgi:hypothetical protein
MMIERYKAIAAYIGAKTGLSISENVARKWAARGEDPLPVERFLGRIVIDSACLDEWLDRQRTAAPGRVPSSDGEGKARPAAGQRGNGHSRRGAR